MKIGLFGFTAAHENMGCQALTYSFLNIIKEYISKEQDQIFLFVYNPIMGRIEKDFPDLKIRCIEISLRKKRKDFLKALKDCDVIFDETFGDGFSDIYFTKSAYKDAVIKYLISVFGLKLVMTPQTYGPFYHKTLEILAAKAIKRAYKVYARDSISRDYANTISKRQVLDTVDLAFSLPFKQPIKEDHKRKQKIGINISGLLWQGGFNKSNQFGLKTDYKEYCKKVIEYCKEKNYELYLIPHVTIPGDKKRLVPDGDVWACEELHRIYPYTCLTPTFDSPVEVKEYIASMDCFIGARMHSVIAAFSAGVVTIPFAYSRKFQGVFDDLGYSFYIDGRLFSTKEAIDKTIEFINISEELKQIQRRALKIVDLMKEVRF